MPSGCPADVRLFLRDCSLAAAAATRLEGAILGSERSYEDLLDSQTLVEFSDGTSQVCLRRRPQLPG